MRTHYDVLMVTRDAPIEVVKAAYRSLALKHHPDKNGHSKEASMRMRMLNASYEVLSDPTKRREHDKWIEKSEVAEKFQETKQTDRSQNSSNKTNATRPRSEASNSSRSNTKSTSASQKFSGQYSGGELTGKHWAAFIKAYPRVMLFSFGRRETLCKQWLKGEDVNSQIIAEDTHSVILALAIIIAVALWLGVLSRF